MFRIGMTVVAALGAGCAFAQADPRALVPQVEGPKGPAVTLPQVNPRASSRARTTSLEARADPLTADNVPAADLSPGTTIYSAAGQPVGVVLSVGGGTVVISTGTANVPIPVTAIRKAGGRLVVDAR